MIEVIEVDQHSSTAKQFDTWNFEKMKKAIENCDENHNYNNTRI